MDRAMSEGSGVATNRPLQKYMDEWHEDKDHAMCNLQNRTIPVVQLTQLQNLSPREFLGRWCSQKLTVMPSTSVRSGSTGN
jgi:hypothetical protein